MAREGGLPVLTRASAGWAALVGAEPRLHDPAFLPSLANVEAAYGDAADADALARLAEKLAELEGAVRAAGK